MAYVIHSVSQDSSGILPHCGKLRSFELFASKCHYISIPATRRTCSSICQGLGTEGLLQNTNTFREGQYISTQHLISLIMKLTGLSPKCGSEKTGRRRSGEATLFWPKWKEYCTSCVWASSLGGRERRTLRKGRRKNQVVVAVGQRGRGMGGMRGDHSDFTAMRLQFPSWQSHME